MLPAGLQNSLPGLPCRGSRSTYIPHTAINRKHVPHQSPDGCPIADYQPEGPIPSPSCSERPATVAHPTGTK